MGTLTELERAFVDDVRSNEFSIVKALVSIIDRLTTPEAQELAEARHTLHVEKIQRLADRLSPSSDAAP